MNASSSDLAPLDLADLIAAAADGDRAAFRALYDATSARLYGLILRIVRDRSSAEDVLQDVYLRVWRGAAAYSPDAGSPLAWLCAIARHRAIDVLRRRSFPAQPPAAETTDWMKQIAAAGDPESDAAALSSLRRCLSAISEPQRSCILLAYYEGYSREELATRFDASANTVKTWLRRSLTALRACLDSRP